MDGFYQFRVCVNQSTATEHLFIKQHQMREVCDQKPQDRTLFVINVSPYLNEKCMEKLFSLYGSVSKVYFHQKPTATVEIDPKEKSKYFSEKRAIKGYKVAYVVFDEPTALKKVISHSSKSNEIHHLDLNACGVLLGVRKWAKMYNDSLINEKEMIEEIELFMANYDKKINEEKDRAKELDGVPDEEGWITVTKRNRKPVHVMDASSGKIASKLRKKRSQKELRQYYTFQIRESKMDRLAEMRKKYEEGKERICASKAKRKFRPF